MKKLFIGFQIAVLLCFEAFTQTSSVTPSVTNISTWNPPVSREKAKIPFAPKPTVGDNIFKGQGEKWLADAILKIEAGSLTTIKDSDVSAYVSRLGQNLVAYSTVPKKQFEFIVVNDSEENAFSIGGGQIYINLGMLQAVKSEDELAAIIAHEIGHDAFGHAPKTVTRQLFWMNGIRTLKTSDEVEKAIVALLESYQKNQFAMVGEQLLGWSRNDELQADKAGFYNMYKAGYNPEAMKNVFKRFSNRDKKEMGDDYAADYFLTLLFGSHPPSSQRVTALKWESNWIKMPPKDEQFKNEAFTDMKARVSKM